MLLLCVCAPAHQLYANQAFHETLEALAAIDDDVALEHAEHVMDDLRKLAEVEAMVFLKPGDVHFDSDINESPLLVNSQAVQCVLLKLCSMI